VLVCQMQVVLLAVLCPAQRAGLDDDHLL
jgi:hypothetical protein